jgi:hypothetical protein
MRDVPTSTPYAAGRGTRRRAIHRGRLLRVVLSLQAVLALATGASAQQPPADWQVDLSVPDPGKAPGGANTTVVPRKTEPAEAVPADMGQVRLVAVLTADGQPIDRGVVWRVFEDQPPDARQPPRIVGTYKDASPLLKLKPGTYIVNLAFGRAHLTRKVSVAVGAPRKEPFVLNAGGLRLTALIGGKPAPANSVSFEIQTDERDQSGNRATVMSGVKPGLIIRLNAGIYHIVSAYGDANAVVRADVTVEAGKLTEATVAHSAAKVTLKLVTKSGGDALPDTQWVLQTPDGVVIKESVGALPTHYLAPGTYTAIAKSQGRAFRRDFSVENGAVTQVEVMMQ